MRSCVRVIQALALAVVMGAGTLVHAQTLPGDANQDGFVGVVDLQIILTNWNQLVTPGDLSRGDLFPDGLISASDLSAVLLNWGQGTIPTPGGDASIGMNLTEVSYFSREWVFVDAMKAHRKWVATDNDGNPFDTGQTVTLDANGWPILTGGVQAVQTLMFQGNGGFYPGGQYVCTYDGTGDIHIDFDASNVVKTPGRITFDVNSPSTAGLRLRINSSAAFPNHVRNIKVWMPGFENAPSPFHPDFISGLQPFGVIRFMDWQQTNGSGVVEWADRTTINTATQDNNFSGVALGHMIQLCNELGADPWFCMPHMASDDYVTQFATMVRDGDPANGIPPLDTNLNIYVEWSNEVWNSQFGQHKWITQQTGSSVFSDAWFNKWASEAKNDFTIWSTVFTGSEDRLIRVAAGQAANVWVTRNLTDRLGDSLDAISCAAYFDHRHNTFASNPDANVVADAILNNAINDTIPNDYAGYYQDHGDLAQELTNVLGRTIPLLAYEGGQHYTAGGFSNHPLFDAFIALQTRPLMYTAYTNNLEAFNQGGGSLYVAYNYVGAQTKYGSWGHLQYQNESTTTQVAPKYRALLDFSSN